MSVRNVLCDECPHKQMHEQTTIVVGYTQKPHVCHMNPEFTCKGALLELKMRGWLDEGYKEEDPLYMKVL